MNVRTDNDSLTLQSCAVSLILIGGRLLLSSSGGTLFAWDYESACRASWVRASALTLAAKRWRGHPLEHRSGTNRRRMISETPCEHLQLWHIREVPRALKSRSGRRFCCRSASWGSSDADDPVTQSPCSCCPSRGTQPRRSRLSSSLWLRPTTRTPHAHWIAKRLQPPCLLERLTALQTAVLLAPAADEFDWTGTLIRVANWKDSGFIYDSVVALSASLTHFQMIPLSHRPEHHSPCPMKNQRLKIEIGFVNIWMLRHPATMKKCSPSRLHWFFIGFLKKAEFNVPLVILQWAISIWVTVERKPWKKSGNSPSGERFPHFSSDIKLFRKTFRVKNVLLLLLFTTLFYAEIVGDGVIFAF